MILSGGLGSSVYVRERIQQHLMSRAHSAGTRIAVISSQDPQLVVVRGLLFEQQQAMESKNRSVLATRIARASYGVLVREAYTPTYHFNEDVVHDHYMPKERWAVNQIQWLIRKVRISIKTCCRLREPVLCELTQKQGDIIDPNNPLIHQLSIRLGPGDMTRSWDTEIVISQNDPSFLPTSMKQGTCANSLSMRLLTGSKKAGVTKLCLIMSNLDGVQQNQLELNRKRRFLFGKGHKFYVCKFEIHIVVAPADLRFELWFDGMKFSGNHEPIAVKWDEAGALVKGD